MLVVLGAAVGLACGFGPVFLGVTGIVLKPMAASFDWSRADVAILPMLGLGGASVGAPLIGYIADRTGWNKVIAISIVLFSLGLMVLAGAPASHAFIVTIGILIGMAGAGTTPAGYIAVISLVFDRRLGLALGLAMIGSGVGGAAMPIIAGRLLVLLDWRLTYVCVGGFCLVTGVVAHQLIFRTLANSESAAGSGTTGQAAEEVLPAGDGLTLSQAIRDYRYWLIGVVVVLVAGATLGTYVHLVSYATDRGISPALAAQSAGLVGFGIALGRIGVGLMLDKLFAPLVALGSFLLGAAGNYLLTTDILQSAWPLPLAGVLVGLAMGAEGDLVPFLTKRYFGVRAFGSIYGPLMGLAGIGSALGAYAYGWCFDLLQSYTPILQASAIICCICGFAILFLGPYRFGLMEAKQNVQ